MDKSTRCCLYAFCRFTFLRGYSTSSCIQLAACSSKNWSTALLSHSVLLLIFESDETQMQKENGKEKRNEEGKGRSS